MPFLPLSPVPVPPAELLQFLSEHRGEDPVPLFEPYRKFESGLREIFAQEPDHPALADPYVNVVPLFPKHDENDAADGPSRLLVHARNLAAESAEEQARYIMPLPDDNRRPHGSPATVQTLKDFRRNFSIFSESSLAELNWDNVVVVGSGVVNCLLPVPNKYHKTKRALREYYHEKFCPASDVDLFLYGLNENEAIEKMKQIETCVRDSILAETTTVRTKHTLTICSQYPTRHIQIVLRLYKSVSEILTGIDIDCSGAAYDGKQVYCTPRALQSYMTQVNHIDLSRRSPSYENRLSKYSHRNFEVYWPLLDRARIDPTIFDRSFQRTLGLARLLVLERLPTALSRQMYARKRREDCGRPPPYDDGTCQDLYNIKLQHEDEVAEWFDAIELSGYNTFHIPYGSEYTAKKIEKMLYTKDLLMNAEWNQKKTREVYLHRHPVFFGRVDNVLHDCCGSCPNPVTDEEKEIAEKESSMFVSGPISFLKDNPGRQEIGSFHPVTDDDWTEMAYVGNTARLCQAIVDGDLEHVQAWLDQEGADPNRRDYTGRTPLHLAVTTSTPEIVKVLVDKGARLMARVLDGRTALHLASQRGNVDIVKILMDKSLANEMEELEREDNNRKAAAAKPEQQSKWMKKSSEEGSDLNSEDDVVEDDSTEDVDAHSATTSSFVQVDKKEFGTADDALNENQDEPDFYDVNLAAWDQPCSAVHFAILAGHIEVVEMLCQEYGADVLLPVKFLGENKEPKAAILTLVLALALPLEMAQAMIRVLLGLGATCSQADLTGVTALQRIVDWEAVPIVQTLIALDKPGFDNSMNHTFYDSSGCRNPLLSAIVTGNMAMAQVLLDAGASPVISFESWLKSGTVAEPTSHFQHIDRDRKSFQERVEQPLIVAIRSSNPVVALALLDHGARPDTKTTCIYENGWDLRLDAYTRAPRTALEEVRDCLSTLRAYTDEASRVPKPTDRSGDIKRAEAYVKTLSEDTWLHLVASYNVQNMVENYKNEMETYEADLKKAMAAPGVPEKQATVAQTIKELEQIERRLLSTCKENAKTIKHEKLPENLGFKEDELEERPPFTPKFNGPRAFDLSCQEDYLKLFEAAWIGDLDTVKRMTLASRGGDNKQPPLGIAVNGNFGTTPFSIAFQRGHFTTAAAILEIGRVQYTPKKKGKVRYEMTPNGGYGDSDSERSSGRLAPYRTIADDDQFTINNIGETNMQVNGTEAYRVLEEREGKTVITDINRELLFRQVYKKHDAHALKFYLDAGEHFGRLKTDPEVDGNEAFGFAVTDDDFAYALGVGHPDLLAEVTKRTGVGLPLDEMVKKAGIKIKQKSRYYQGLIVYGKRRSDWAEVAGRSVQGPKGLWQSPLLVSAWQGCLESVEWCLSGAPLRCYLEFANSEAALADARVTYLKQEPGGFEGAVSRWLEDENQHVMFQVLESDKKTNLLPLIKFLAKAMPQLLSARNADGKDLLHVACSKGYFDVARFLVENGADPLRPSESAFENKMHAIVDSDFNVKEMRAFLDVLNPEDVRQMLCQRSHHTAYSAGRTPLHYLIGKHLMQQYSQDVVIEAMRIFLAFSGGEDVVLLDSAGNTILHSLVTSNRETAMAVMTAMLEAISPHQAVLVLRRENSVGRTPLELARDHFTTECATEEGPMVVSLPYGVLLKDWPSTQPQAFLGCDGNGERQLGVPTGREVEECVRMLDLLESFLERFPGPRRLVSLFEINELLKESEDDYVDKRYTTTVCDILNLEDEEQRG